MLHIHADVQHICSRNGLGGRRNMAEDKAVLGEGEAIKEDGIRMKGTSVAGGTSASYREG